MNDNKIVYCIGLTAEGVWKWLEIGEGTKELLLKIDEMKKNGKTSSVIDFSEIEKPLYAIAIISNKMLEEISNDKTEVGENNAIN